MVKENNMSIPKFKQTFEVEYKYFNDNMFLNLETEFLIHVSDNLTYDELLEYQKPEIMSNYFKLYINKHKTNKFTDDEMLFLYNKYSVVLLSNPVRLANNYNEKIYTLTYKFTLI
jgi:hypothetical protein